MVLKETALVLNMLFSQGPEEYEDMDMKSLEDSINTLYWNERDFVDFGGGPWKIFDDYDDDIAIAFRKPFIKDTIVDTKYFTVLKVYFLPVLVRALKNPVKVDFFRSPIFMDESKKLWINWFNDYGKHFYEQYNQLKLRTDAQGRSCDIVSVGTAKPIQRILPIVVAQTTVQGEELARFEPFLKGVISLKYGNTIYEIDNFPWHEKYYRIKKDE